MDAAGPVLPREARHVMKPSEDESRQGPGHAGAIAPMTSSPTRPDLHPDGEFYREVLDNLSDGVLIVDAERRITYWNHGAERISGYLAADVLGRQCHDDLLLSGEADGCRLCLGQCPLAAAIEKGAVHEAEVSVRHRQGHRLPVLVHVTPIRDREGKTVGAVEVFNDATHTVAAPEKIGDLEEMALLDPLTGLGNRRYSEVAISDRLGELKRFGWHFGVLMLGLERLEETNDQRGPGVGDEVLKVVGRTLLASTRTHDFVGRWGAREFVVVVGNVRSGRLARIAERFRALVEASVLPHQGGPLRVTISEGATLARLGESVEDLARRAGGLMAEARRSGRGGVAVG